jgi:hypothetical protein
MGLIAGSAIACLMSLYVGLSRLITGQLAGGVTCLGVGAIVGAGCYVLCKHSDDLIDR